MPIRIYPSLLPGLPIEEHAHVGTLADWLLANGINYDGHAVQPVIASVNGQPFPASQWSAISLSADDDVALRVVPAGGVFSFVSKIFNFVFGWLLPKPNVPNSAAQGQQLEPAAAKANTARLMQVVPEMAGRFKRYPDYLTPPRRYFSAPREQWIEFLCCIGPGKYHVLDDDVKIGDTTFSALGADAEYVLIEPGEDVSAHAAHEHWYNVDAVGGTSSGTAGLELTTDSAPPSSPDAQSYVFDGADVSIPTGAGAFPASWAVGDVLDVVLPQVYAVSTVDIGTGTPELVNQFAGNFLELAAGIGDELLLSGQVSGSYVVADMALDSAGNGWVQLDYIGGGHLYALADGDRVIAFRQPERLYKITSKADAVISVQRLLVGGEDDSAWPGFPAISSLVASLEFDGATLSGEWTSAFSACPAAEKTDCIEVDLFFPQGLGKIKDDGNVKNRSVSVEIQYRDADVGGVYTAVPITYTAGTLDQVGYTERIFLPEEMRPEVRIRRIGAKSTSPQVQDTLQWYGLRSRLKTRTSYPGWTTMAVRIRGGGKLAARSENQINIVATRKLQQLQPDGIWGAEQPTRQIAAFVKYIAGTIGYADDDLNMDRLLALQSIWTARGETVDHIFDETTVKSALDVCFSAGMAAMTIDDGCIAPVRDGVRTAYEQSYSPQNMTGALQRTFKSRRLDDADGVQVEFISAENGWVSETVDCLLPGDVGVKLEKIKLEGVTDRVRAWRIGMRRRRELRYRRWEYAFATEMDALNSSWMSYVALIDDLPGYGKSMLLVDISDADGAARLQVSEPVEFDSVVDHVVAWRKPDGTLSGPWPASPGVGAYEIIAEMPEPWPVPTMEMELPHVYFGALDRWVFPALVMSVNPQNAGAVNVTAANYDVRVYADDDNAPDS